MFASISTASALKIKDLRHIVQYIKNNESDLNLTLIIKAQKGLFFVHLYGIYEWVITNTVNESIRHINNSSIPLNQVKPIFYSLALHPDCDALHDAGSKTKWNRRWTLFDKIEKVDCVQISPDVMPTDGSNFNISQLRSIRNSFGIGQDLFRINPDQGKIEELVRNRNYIAHGNSTPMDVGSGYTSSDLEDRLNILEANCLHFISTFETYLINKDFLK